MGLPVLRCMIACMGILMRMHVYVLYVCARAWAHVCLCTCARTAASCANTYAPALVLVASQYIMGGHLIIPYTVVLGVHPLAPNAT